MNSIHPGAEAGQPPAIVARATSIAGWREPPAGTGERRRTQAGSLGAPIFFHVALFQNTSRHHRKEQPARCPKVLKSALPVNEA